MSHPLTSAERERVDLAVADGGFNEPNATKAMGVLLANDQDAAARLVKGIVRLLRPEEVAQVPRRLDCRANIQFYGRRLNGETRYADLAFYSTEQRYLVFLEAKLGAATGQKQIGDYVRAKLESIDIPLGSGWWDVPRGTTIRVGLIGRKALISRDIRRAWPTVGAERRKRWLGSATWLELADVLADVRFADDERASCWSELIAHYSGHDGLGIDHKDRLTPEQLLDGSALSLNRRQRSPAPLTAVPWNDRTEKIVRNRGAAAMLLLRSRRAKGTIVTVRLSEPHPGAELQLEIRTNHAISSFGVPVPATGDLCAFQDFLTCKLAILDSS